jgi:hypothetical protein
MTDTFIPLKPTTFSSPKQKCFRSNYMAQKASFLSQAFIIPESNNPSEMLDNIIRSLPTFQMIGFYHCLVSGMSTVVQRILINCVSQGNQPDGKFVLFSFQRQNFQLTQVAMSVSVYEFCPGVLGQSLFFS